MTRRVGFGYDVHKFEKGRKLVLGGVEVPYEAGLAGHSDADVVLHALCDALLGAAGKGDIGEHFPDTEAKYKDIDSTKLLEETVAVLKSDRFAVVNADITIAAEAPNLKAYKGQMCGKIANALSVPDSRVNIKATTTEGLGFTGRKEGIAAYAVCMIVKEE